MNIIMVIGLPGTGKTTFAKSLAEALDAQHINTDIIRDSINKRGQYDPETKAKIYKEMLEQAETALNKGQNVVLDGTFFKKELRKPYREMATKYQANLYWMEIKAKEDVIRTRVSQRRAYSEADFEVYLKIKSQYEPLEAPHLELWSDALDLPEMVKKAKDYINTRS